MADMANIYAILVKDLGGPTKAAKRLGVSQAAASCWVKGDYGMSPIVAMRAERVTKGKFKAVDLNEKLREEFSEASVA